MAAESRPSGGTSMAPLPGSLSCIQRYMTALTLMGNQLAHVDSSFRGKNRHIDHLVLRLSQLNLLVSDMSLKVILRQPGPPRRSALAQVSQALLDRLGQRVAVRQHRLAAHFDFVQQRHRVS